MASGIKPAQGELFKGPAATPPSQIVSRGRLMDLSVIKNKGGQKGEKKRENPWNEKETCLP